jgi:peptidoglycan/xylan/chitin deacetylase (PgdA/CDA1 family)
MSRLAATRPLVPPSVEITSPPGTNTIVEPAPTNRPARIAISLVVNYEKGSENLLQDGIGKRETAGESTSPVSLDRRDRANDSFFEYGSRAGVWRLFRSFKKHGVRGTFFACAVALERNPSVGPAIAAAGHDVLGQGNRCQRPQRTA